ncbi:MAG: hypothetical protein WBP15_06150, partial [Tabrizicola sp.]
VQGLAVWPEPAAVPPLPPLAARGEGGASGEMAGFLADLRGFGYPDAAPEILLTAFRLRFRPWAKGPLDDTDLALAAGLRRFAVDGSRGGA